ncbi:MAG: pyridoxal phosphate-dependent aminotransferase family protein [Bacteroidales bacterium]|jgi:8-amino-7-oxononanoate synthase|nr:pyridoxal phosphate-dependent aminotransferase family protein [Bacteroidales bacterium]MDN5350489.1 8-amino-7-oxononanoate synthase [Bacteroidales bacterium]
MNMLLKKMAGYDRPQMAKELGIYPYYHPIESGQDSEVLINGKKVLMFGSNSYLGLTNHPKLIEAAKDALDKYGTGASGSRLMNGNLDLHEKLEASLAEFTGKPASVVFSTGFQTNLGTVSALTGRNDFILMDEKNHASIIEGSRLSYAKSFKYRHNDMSSLEENLKKTVPNQIVLIVVDGVFSMEGDIAPLDEICRLAKKYSAAVMVDDAHALGVLGKGGAGTSSHFNVTDNVDLIMGTFSKSLASLGGFVASDLDTINFLKHNARSLLFSAGIPPASAAVTLKALQIIKEEPERREKLWENTEYARLCLQQAGFDIGESKTPIIPIFIGDDQNTFTIATLLMAQGVYVNPIIHPAVAKDKAMLRFSLMSTHTKKQIDTAIAKLIHCRAMINGNLAKVTV